MTVERRSLVLAGIVALIVIALALLWWSRRDGLGSGKAGESGEAAAGGPTVTVTLYFPGADGRLHGEPRELPQLPITEQVRAIAEAVLAGPRDQALSAPLPPEIELGGVLVGAGGIAYVDLRQPGVEHPLAAGSLEEMLAVYSLVNSVALNSSLVRAVTLLWNGAQLESFGGHLDTTAPLRPASGLLAKTPAAPPAAEAP